ncbi:hypothetical protein ACH4S9_10565 [Streptomyces sp. NPDC021225]|uniref:hypothetical protein n=1 Tax=Streptomyces sp. NPDC021225 TaxID=3365121 RepID=UPI0037890BAD
MPPLSEQALRVAVRALAPSASVRFEAELHHAKREAAKADSTVPTRTFLHRWDVFVALRRHPYRARRLQELERAVGQADGIEDARRASAEIGRLLDAARREVSGGA